MNTKVMESGVVKREAISSQIAAKLRADIFIGKYNPGDRLPPEREIAERSGISRVTVRQALQELAREEWIEIIQGRGATVLDYKRKIGLDVLPALFSSSPQIVVSPETFITIYDFYNWLFRQICLSAAKNACPDDRRNLIEIISAYKNDISVNEYFRIEEEYYQELLSIGNNLILRMFFNTYMKTINYIVEAGELPLPLLPGDLCVKINTDMINAICDKNPDLVDTVYERYKPEIFSVVNRYMSILGIDISGSKG